MIEFVIEFCTVQSIFGSNLRSITHSRSCDRARVRLCSEGNVILVLSHLVFHTK